MKERAIATQAETLEWHKKRWGQRNVNPLLPPLSCPAFAATAVMEDGHSEGMITKESFIEDYVLLLFMPMEGNVDKAELEAFSAELDHLAHLGCQVGKFDQPPKSIIGLKGGGYLWGQCGCHSPGSHYPRSVQNWFLGFVSSVRHTCFPQWSISAKTGFPIISDKSLDLAKAFGVRSIWHIL